MATKTNTPKARKKQLMTGWLLLVVGICAMLIGWLARTDDFWRGATFGVGLAAVLISLSYLYPKYIKSV
jgi:hypothetical protein